MEFIDTNILIYCFDVTAGTKRETAIELIGRLSAGRTGCTSLQVLQEFYVNAIRKLGIAPADVKRELERIGKWPIFTPQFADVVSAMELQRKKSISYWDALVIRSAQRMNCSILWTEDLNHLQKFDRLKIRNPFLTQ